MARLFDRATALVAIAAVLGTAAIANAATKAHPESVWIWLYLLGRIF